MSKITKEVVKHVAHLARLEFSEEEAEKMTSQLDKMIRYAEMLNELDTDQCGADESCVKNAQCNA